MAMRHSYLADEEDEFQQLYELLTLHTPENREMTSQQPSRDPRRHVQSLETLTHNGQRQDVPTGSLKLNRARHSRGESRVNPRDPPSADLPTDEDRRAMVQQLQEQDVHLSRRSLVESGRDLDPGRAAPQSDLAVESRDTSCTHQAAPARQESDLLTLDRRWTLPPGWATGATLFADLLDDLDTLSVNVSPDRRSQNARELFRGWLGGGPEPERWVDSTQTLPTDLRSADQRGLRRHCDVTTDDADSGYLTRDSTLRSSCSVRRSQLLGECDVTLLRQQIQLFNENHHGLHITQDDEGDSYRGSVRIYMNLIRPINMTISQRPPTLYDVMSMDEMDKVLEADSQQLTETFHLPKGTSKVIHITNDTTAQDVIKLLLNKFKITDNPLKFSLYERRVVTSEGQVVTSEGRPVMRKVREDERPLAVCLGWSSAGLDHTRFVLQENDTMEILWEAFSVPELENFLRILDREQEEYVSQLRQRYHLLHTHVRRRLDALRPADVTQAEQRSV